MRRRRKVRVVKHPNTVKKYEQQVQERIQLLLDVRPSWLTRSMRYPVSLKQGSGGREGGEEEEEQEQEAIEIEEIEGGRQLSQASSRWRETMPENLLTVLVERWNSHDSREERDVLKRKWKNIFSN